MDKRLPSTLNATSSMRRRSEKFGASRSTSSCTTTARKFDKELPLPPQDNSFSDIPLTPRLAEKNSNRQPPGPSSRLPPALSRLLSKRRTSDSSPLASVAPSNHASSSIPARPKLLSNYSSSANFTQKWPKPRINPSAIGSLVMALDESEGLGMDQVDTWTVYKWTLLISIITAFIVAFVGLICAILTWFRGWDHADVMYVADGDVLVLMTIAASILLFTSLVGTCGALLNSRPLLAVYTLLLWPSFISLAAIGYLSYKRSAFALDRKLNLAWSQWYNPTSRLIIQDSLRCCGYFNALHEATPSKRCFPRTTLPGCKGKLYRFERRNLETIWSTVFSLVPLYLIIIFVSLLCSNHVTRTFGKGITPRGYRLGNEDVKADEELVFKKFKDAGVISRPAMSKTSASGIFREDRSETRALLAVEEDERDGYIYKT